MATFSPGSQNPDVAAITSSYYNLFGRETFPVELLYGANFPFTNPGDVGYYENFNEIQARNGR